MKKIKNKFITLISLIILAIIATATYQIFFSNDRVVVKHLHIHSDKINAPFITRIGVISDIKYGKFMTKERLEKFIVKLNNENVDTVFFLGDLFHQGVEISEHQIELTNILKTINPKAGKFYVFGNDDNQEKIKPIFDNAHFESLNESYTLLHNSNESIQVFGLNTTYKDIFKSLNDSKYAIVLSHYPQLVTALPSSINLVLSGHTLGNQINIPLFTNSNNEYTLGKYEISNNTTLYVNGGLGTENTDIRFFSSPEITIITIEGTKK